MAAPTRSYLSLLTPEMFEGLADSIYYYRDGLRKLGAFLKCFREADTLMKCGMADVQAFDPSGRGRHIHSSLRVGHSYLLIGLRVRPGGRCAAGKVLLRPLV
jgi:hypothetical protein